jgi:heme A synthase
LGVKLLIFIGGLIFIGIFGAIASLASTLFPSDTFIEGVQNDFAENVHYLIRLRIWHPVLATVMGLYFVIIFGSINAAHPSSTLRGLTGAVMVLFWMQFILGGMNAFLLAPIWLQMTHLLVTHLLWIMAVLMTAAAMVAPVTTTEPTAIKPAAHATD